MISKMDIWRSGEGKNPRLVGKKWSWNEDVPRAGSLEHLDPGLDVGDSLSWNAGKKSSVCLGLSFLGISARNMRFELNSYDLFVMGGRKKGLKSTIREKKLKKMRW